MTCNVENFKKYYIVFCTIITLLWGCDPIYHFRTNELKWNITNPPKEVIHIKGTSNAFPILTKITILKKDSNKTGNLLIISSDIIPDSAMLADLYVIPLDSIAKQDHFLDENNNSFYKLALINLTEKDTIIQTVEKPIIHLDNYIFGLLSNMELDLKIKLEFERLGINKEPVVKTMKINNKLSSK